MKRRHFLKIGSAAGIGLSLPLSFTPTQLFADLLKRQTLDPAFQAMFKFQNLAPNALDPGFIYQPLSVKKSKATKKTIERYIIGAYEFSHDAGLAAPGSTPGNKIPWGTVSTAWGYGDSASTPSYPGKTIEIKKNRQSRIKWYNKLMDNSGSPLPHFLPTDDSVHWAFGHINKMMGTNYTLQTHGVPLVPHVHGGHTCSDFDGLPEFWFTPDFAVVGPRWVQEEYVYDNDQEAGTLWYHDHALGITRVNVYAGLAGFYIVRDTKDTGKTNNPLKLPAFPYEAAFAIQDKMFDDNGQFYFPAFPDDPSWEDFIEGEGATPPNINGPSILTEFFGDHILVNGVTWPKMDVEPRNYRFRLLNGSDSRFYVFKFTLDGDETPLPFYQVGTDDGLLPNAVPLTSLIMGPGERHDIVIDFAQAGIPFGSRVIMKNTAPDEPFKGLNPDGTNSDGMGGIVPPADPNTTGQIMAFDVNEVLNTAIPDNFNPGKKLRASGPFVVSGAPKVVRKLVLFEGNDQYGRLRPQLGIYDPASPLNGSLLWDEAITENPMKNDVEEWDVYNATMDVHPIHLHLVSFEIKGRRNFVGGAVEPNPVNPEDPANFDMMEGGSKRIAEIISEDPYVEGAGVAPNELGGPKDTALMYPGQVTRIKAKFDLPGRYVWHCHILSHEDHEMMRPYHVGPLPVPAAARLAGEEVTSFKVANYPNPFQDYTMISFNLPEESTVDIRILDIQGRLVHTMGKASFATGIHEIKWNGTDSMGRALSSGLYICQMVANGKVVAAEKMQKV
ncbi:MAG: multicopper oxidase domain-containing protein [Bacteroidia bacterium]